MRKNILITGASSGLGRQMAREFAARGANLALCARRLDRLEELKAELTAKHPGHHGRHANARRHRHRRGVRRRQGVPGRPRRRSTGWSSTPGWARGSRSAPAASTRTWQTAQTNFIGALAQIEAAMEVFREQDDGHLVIISSVSALRGHAAEHDDVRRHQGRRGLARRGPARGADAPKGDRHRRSARSTPATSSSEMNERLKQKPRVHGRAPRQGTRAIVAAIEKEKASARGAGLAVGAARCVAQGRAAAASSRGSADGRTCGLDEAGAVRAEDAFDAAAVDAWLRAQPGSTGLTGAPRGHASSPAAPRTSPTGCGTRTATSSCAARRPARRRARRTTWCASTGCSGSSSRSSAYVPTVLRAVPRPRRARRRLLRHGPHPRHDPARPAAGRRHADAGPRPASCAAAAVDTLVELHAVDPAAAGLDRPRPRPRLRASARSTGWTGPLRARPAPGTCRASDGVTDWLAATRAGRRRAAASSTTTSASTTSVLDPDDPCASSACSTGSWPRSATR